MSKIVLIATSNEMYELGCLFKESLENPENLHIHMAYMDGAVQYAKELDNKDVDVIICRGASGNMVCNAEVDIPVMNMPLTDIEVMETMNEAYELATITEPEIAFVGYTETYLQIKTYLSAMGMNIHHYPIENQIDNDKILEEVRGKKVDVIVCGASTKVLADQFGIKNVIMKSSIESIASAYNIAYSMQKAIIKEKKIAEETNTIINSISEIIININKKKEITLFNAHAEKIFGYKAKDVLGEKISQVCDCLNLNEMTEAFITGDQITGSIVECNNKKYALSINPVQVKDNIESLVILLQEINEIQRIEAKFRKELYFKGNIARYNFQDIQWASDKMERTINIAKSFAKVDSNVLIIGETGTGKEMLAQSIHNASNRNKGPFVAINCGAIPRGLAESELFGYVDGAFTGAKKGGKIGYFELAHGGTIFLDEISDMDQIGQVALLRALQEKHIRRVGGDSVIPVDVRIIAASNSQLYDLTKKNKFRKDLFFRLCVLVLNIPALRDRQEDIYYLAKHFIDEYNKVFNKNISLSMAALNVMERFNWEGNHRQLKNFCERIVAISTRDIIDGDFVQNEINNSYFFLSEPLMSSMDGGKDETEALDKDVVVIHGKVYDKDTMKGLLAQQGGNRTSLAKDLGISRTTLWKYLKELKI